MPFAWDVKATASMYKANERLYLDATKTKVVKDGDPTAAFLLVSKGGEMPEGDARKWGLLPSPFTPPAPPPDAEPVEATNDPEPAPAVKAVSGEPELKAVEAAPENKAIQTAPNKGFHRKRK